MCFKMVSNDCEKLQVVLCKLIICDNKLFVPTKIKFHMSLVIYFQRKTYHMIRLEPYNLRIIY